MAKLSKQKVTWLIIVVSALIIVSGKTILQTYRSSIEPSSIPAKAKGNPQAKFKIVEYIDFQCPACAQGMKILKEYFAKYPDRIYAEVKYFPLPGHPYGMLSARYAECAARQKRFWPFVDKLIERQSLWASLHDPIPAFHEIAKQTGVNSFQLDNCLNDKYLDEAILTEKTIGASLGIQSTPTYFINDKMLVGTKSLQEELNKFFEPTPAPTPVASQ